MLHWACGHQKTTASCHFPLSIMWVPGVDFRSSDLTAGTATHLFSILNQTIELVRGDFKYQFKFNFNDNIFPNTWLIYFTVSLKYD